MSEEVKKTPKKEVDANVKKLADLLNRNIPVQARHRLTTTFLRLRQHLSPDGVKALNLETDVPKYLKQVQEFYDLRVGLEELADELETKFLASLANAS